MNKKTGCTKGKNKTQKLVKCRRDIPSGYTWDPGETGMRVAEYTKDHPDSGTLWTWVYLGPTTHHRTPQSRMIAGDQSPKAPVPTQRRKEGPRKQGPLATLTCKP